MEKLSILLNEQDNLKIRLKAAKNRLKESFRKHLDISEESEILVINDKFISIELNDVKDLQDALLKAKPYKTSHRVKHSNFEHDIASPFKVSFDSSPKYSHKLRFEYVMINELKIWLELDFNKLPQYIKDKYFLPYERKITTSEHHYFTGMSYKQLNNYHVHTYKFKGYQLDWYGGDKTLLTHDKNEVYSDVLHNLIKDLASGRNVEQY